MGGGSANEGGGINFSARKLREGGKISVQALRGGGGTKFQCTGHLKAILRQQKYTIKNFAATSAADIFQYVNL